MKQLTEESLGIFWNGEEVDGLTIYGYFDYKKDDAPVISSDIWKDNYEIKTHKLFGDDWTVWLWDIRINKWPEQKEWLNFIKSILHKMIKQGASLSWAGLEGHFVDPPDLFKPEFMRGGVWAVYTKLGGFYCEAQLGRVFKTLDDSILEDARKKARL